MIKIQNNSKIYSEVISIYKSGNKNPANISLLTSLSLDLVSSIINDFLIKKQCTDPLVPTPDDDHVLKSEIIDDDLNISAPKQGYPEESYKSLLFDDEQMTVTVDPSFKL